MRKMILTAVAIISLLCAAMPATAAESNRDRFLNQLHSDLTLFSNNKAGFRSMHMAYDFICKREQGEVHSENHNSSDFIYNYEEETGIRTQYFSDSNTVYGDTDSQESSDTAYFLNQLHYFPEYSYNGHKSEGKYFYEPWQADEMLIEDIGESIPANEPSYTALAYLAGLFPGHCFSETDKGLVFEAGHSEISQAGKLLVSRVKADDAEALAALPVLYRLYNGQEFSKESFLAMYDPDSESTDEYGEAYDEFDDGFRIKITVNADSIVTERHQVNSVVMDSQYPDYVCTTRRDITSTLDLNKSEFRKEATIENYTQIPPNMGNSDTPSASDTDALLPTPSEPSISNTVVCTTVWSYDTEPASIKFPEFTAENSRPAPYDALRSGFLTLLFGF